MNIWLNASVYSLACFPCFLRDSEPCYHMQLLWDPTDFHGPLYWQRDVGWAADLGLWSLFLLWGQERKHPPQLGKQTDTGLSEHLGNLWPRLNSTQVSWVSVQYLSHSCIISVFPTCRHLDLRHWIDFLWVFCCSFPSVFPFLFFPSSVCLVREQMRYAQFCVLWHSLLHDAVDVEGWHEFKGKRAKLDGVTKCIGATSGLGSLWAAGGWRLILYALALFLIFPRHLLLGAAVHRILGRMDPWPDPVWLLFQSNIAAVAGLFFLS